MFVTYPINKIRTFPIGISKSRFRLLSVTVINKQNFTTEKKKILSRAGLQTKQVQMKLSEKKSTLKKQVIKIASGYCWKEFKM